MSIIESVQALGNAQPVKGLEPGTPEWMMALTATKVPAILGVDRYGTTRYQLWQQLAGFWSPTFKGNSATRRGTHLEAGIAAWWAEEHGKEIIRAGTWQATDHPSWYATPDYLVAGDDGPELLEIKTSRDMHGFGDPESGIIPSDYWSQVAWQCIVTGIRVVNVAVLGPWLERKDYRLDFDDMTLALIEDEVQEFLATLPGGAAEFEPTPDDPVHDWVAMLAVTEVEVEKSDQTELYQRYAEAKRGSNELSKQAAELQKRIKAAGADAEAIVADGRVVATRTDGADFKFKPVRG